MKKPEILVPTDLSLTGNRAFATAEIFRKLYDGTITPMHTFREVIWPEGISMPNVGEVLSTEIKRQISARLTEVAKQFVDEDGLNVPLIDYGDPFNRILEESEKRDLVVLTTHGKRGFKKALLGSVAEKMIRYSKVPVIISKGVEKAGSEIKRILITTDFSDASYKSFPAAAEIIRKTGAKADLLHIVSLEHTGTMQEGRKLAHKAELKLDFLRENHFNDVKDNVNLEVDVTTNSPHIAIGSVINNREYDLLVISRLGRTALGYMLIGSNAESLIRTVRCPVMVINPDT